MILIIFPYGFSCNVYNFIFLKYSKTQICKKIKTEGAMEGQSAHTTVALPLVYSK